MLGPHDDLRHQPRRVLVAGVSGSGKSTLAGELSRRLGIAYTELDGIYHGPGWVPREEFVADVTSLASDTTWITDWLYEPARPLLAARADTVVWLDLPSPIVLGRVVRRTISRSRRATELWNGNVEPPLRTFLTDPEHIVRWAWKTRNNYRRSVPKLEHEHPALQVVRLASRRDVDDWLGHLG